MKLKGRIGNIARDTEKLNSVKFFFRNIMYNMTLMFSSGAVIQTLLLNSGVSPELVAFFSSFATVCQIATYIAFFGVFDRIKNIRLFITGSIALHIAPIIALMPFCFMDYIKPGAIFAAALVSGAIQNCVISVKSILENRFIYYIVSESKRSRVYAIEGTFTGTAGIAAGIGFSVLTKAVPYYTAVAVALTACAVFISAACVLNHKIKPISSLMPAAQKRSIYKSSGHFFGNMLVIFKRRDFYYMLAPNIARGVTLGIVGLAAVYGMKFKGLSEFHTSLIVTANMVSTVFACLFFAFLIRKRVSEQSVTLWGGVICSAGILLMIISPSPIAFVAFYLIAYIGIVINNYSIPLMVFLTTSPEIIGGYTALRLIMTSAAISITIFLAGLGMDRVPMAVVFAAAAAAQLLSGILYRRAANRLMAEKEPAE